MESQPLPRLFEALREEVTDCGMAQQRQAAIAGEREEASVVRVLETVELFAW